jgi:hypothetical protein
MLTTKTRTILAAGLLTGLMPLQAMGQAAAVTSQPAAITTQKLATPVPLNFDLTINPTAGVMSSQATSVSAAYQRARESTLLGLYYLRSSQSNIVAGRDTIYNDVFGAYYDKNNVHFKQGVYLIDNTHYLQVHNTFATIRTLLDSPATFGLGAQFNPASLTTVDGATTAVFGATRGWRQWGFSNTGNSGTSAAGVSPGTTTQLRWIDDNDPSFGRAFFNEKLDAYRLPVGAAVSTNNQQVFLGNVFFSELERPSDHYGRDTPPPPGTLRKTELSRDQMLIAAFSEFSTTFTNPNIPIGPPVIITRGGAFFGLRELERFSQPDGSPNFYDAYDARNFGRFVKRLAEIGLDDVRKLPPLNKNAQFRPIIPVAPAAGS